MFVLVMPFLPFSFLSVLFEEGEVAFVSTVFGLWAESIAIY